MPPLPSIVSFPSPPQQRLDAFAAGDRVVSGAAIEGQGDRLGCERCRRDRVVAAEPVDRERVVRLLVLNRHQRCQTGHGDTGGVSADVDRVVAVGAVDGDAVGLAVAGGPTEGAGEVDVDVVTSVPVRSLTETTSAPPRALKSTRSTPAVSIVTLPGSRRNVRRFPFADRATRSATLAPLNTHRVGAVLAFDRVAAVAWIPDEGVVAGTQQGQVVAAVAVDRVVPVAAEQRLDAFAAGDRVVSGAAVDRRRDAVGEDAVALVDAHDVVAGRGRRRRSLATRSRAEAEVGRAVVTDVDLENAGLAGLQTKRDLVARLGALDRQHAVLELRVLELVRLVCVRRLLTAARAPHFPGPATIPAAPATAAARPTAQADNHAGRAVRDSLSRMRFFMVFLSEWLISPALKTPASGAYSRAVGHALTRRSWSLGRPDRHAIGDLQRGPGPSGSADVRSCAGITSAEAGSFRA